MDGLGDALCLVVVDHVLIAVQCLEKFESRFEIALAACITRGASHLNTILCALSTEHRLRLLWHDTQIIPRVSYSRFEP